MADVHLKYINAVHMKVVADPSIIMELSDTLTFKAPNYQFNPKYKARMWNGDIKLLNTLSATMYAGLAKRVMYFCKTRDYTMSFDKEFQYLDITEEQVKNFIKTLDIPSEYESRDYQIDSIVKCLTSGKRTLISPTSSGKSFMIYVISRWYQKEKSLIIVPRTGLVEQMTSDFREYGYKGTIASSVGGLSKEMDIDADIVITTWQSLDNGKTKMPKQWYKQFGVVFGDECFVEGTKVLTPTGYKKIETLSSGDKIINYDEISKKFKEDTIVSLHTNLQYTSNDSVLELEFEDNSTIQVTESHKFLTERGWISAKDLTLEDDIIFINR